MDGVPERISLMPVLSQRLLNRVFAGIVQTILNLYTEFSKNSDSHGQPCFAAQAALTVSINGVASIKVKHVI